MSKTTEAIDTVAASLVSKFDSRKFLVFAGAFAVALVSGLSGCIDGSTTIQAVLLAAFGYGISEAIPDLGGALSNKTIESRSVQATAVDKSTVQAVFTGDATPKEQQ